MSLAHAIPISPLLSGFAPIAFDKIVEAQKANEWDMAGHAQKAKDLLDQVNNELKLAAQAANKNGK
ncbi:MAG: hypothetical protein ABSG03_18900 [Bryobacteraceae bacterium]|jgi:hypothetical protein